MNPLSIEQQQDITNLIRQGEGLTLEFKTCRNQINRDVYETVCAFLNRHGGTILLGVSDTGEVTGVEPDAVAQIRKDFVNTINNPQKMHPPAYLSVEELGLDGKTLLRVYVPESSQVHRCNGRIYDRNEDGDFDITDHTRQVAGLYHRKQTSYSENKLYPYAGLSDLRTDLIANCRKVAGVWRRDHPWLKMDDMELLKSAQLYQTDHETGKSGVTLAGILLFGKDSVILSAVPHHRTDLILRKVNLDRYDDRDLVRTNLIESFDRIMAFVDKHLSDPFYLEGIQRVSIRSAIFREVASNLLIHREYLNAFPAKLIIEYGQVRTENASKPHGFGVLNPATFTPFPKNPVISAFFREIQHADELGSGMRRMMKYGKAYGGGDPEMIEGDVFRTIVKVPEFGKPPPASTELAGFTPTAKAQEAQVEAQEAQEKTPHWQIDILAACASCEKTANELLSVAGYTQRTGNFKKALAKLLDAGLIEMTIPDKPNSRLQKYRLTPKGQNLLASSKDRR